MKKKVEKRCFSAYQIICLGGRIQDYCKEKKINFDKYSDRLIKILKKQQEDGADMDVCLSLMQKEVDKISKQGEQKENLIESSEYSVYSK